MIDTLHPLYYLNSCGVLTCAWLRLNLGVVDASQHEIEWGLMVKSQSWEPQSTGATIEGQLACCLLNQLFIDRPMLSWWRYLLNHKWLYAESHFNPEHGYSLKIPHTLRYTHIEILDLIPNTKWNGKLVIITCPLSTLSSMDICTTWTMPPDHPTPIILPMISKLN